jgi:nitrite reductase/ring-hydroxylating ferredoxin subunit
MSEYIEVAKTGDLADGEMIKVKADGHSILLAKAGGVFYAVQEHCPHLGANLAKGKLDGTIVTCPLHGSQFDLKDGSVVRWTSWTGTLEKVAEATRHPRPLKTYSVKVDGDKILIAPTGANG